MTEPVAIALAALILIGGALRATSWYRRHLQVRDIDPQSILRERRGVSMKVMVQGTRTLPGMSTSRANRTTGDLILMQDRFLLTSGRGPLADLRPGRRKFKSVRCTGPGRLVIEGDVPNSGDRPDGLYRVELVVEDANEWAKALEPWVREGGEFVSFAPGGPPSPS